MGPTLSKRLVSAPLRLREGGPGRRHKGPESELQAQACPGSRARPIFGPGSAPHGGASEGGTLRPTPRAPVAPAALGSASLLCRSVPFKSGQEAALVLAGFDAPIIAREAFGTHWL